MRVSALVRSVRAAAAALLCAGCAEGGGVQSMLAPAGDQAAEVRALWWFFFAVAVFVFVVVTALLLWGPLMARPEPPDEPPETERAKTRAVAGGIAATVVLLAALFAGSLLTDHGKRPLPSDGSVTVEVVGHQFWWEVRYPGPDGDTLVTANEIRLPIGRPALFRVWTADVIHSFWVPNLGGKIDMIPGRINHLRVRPREAGIYRGQCAEFCGMQHAKMALLVVVEPEAEFEAWLARERRPAEAQTQDEQARDGHAHAQDEHEHAQDEDEHAHENAQDEDEHAHENAQDEHEHAHENAQDEHEHAHELDGREVFMTKACVACHTIRGTRARGTLGPDLTHVASRLTLAAGTLENHRGNLSAWISDPQAIKPGNLMPHVPLSPAELHAVVHYLESLK